MKAHKTKCLYCKKEAEIEPSEIGIVDGKDGPTLYRYKCPYCNRYFWRRRMMEVKR